MSPEPILCFDGDGAGRRAAAKALDTALPALTPDKTLRFAFLPDGQDPDDLARAGGQKAVAAVLDGAKPLVEVLWARETGAAALDTPERRAGLKRRLGELTRQIGDETLRRYYAEELYGRLDALTGGGRRAGSGRVAAGRPASFQPAARRPFGAPPPLRGYRGSAPAPLSASAARRSDGPGEVARRDAEILTLVMNHPALLDRYAEDLAHLDLGAPALALFRDCMLELLAEHVPDHLAFKAALDARGAGEMRRRIEAVTGQLPHWCMAPEAAVEDAEAMLRQALALHRRARELHRDVKQAELAFASEASASHFAQLCDLRAQFTTQDGTEATIEGYGLLSGHAPSAE